MSFLLGLLVGLAAGVVSYLLFAASSRKSSVIVNNADSGAEEVQPNEDIESLLSIRDAVNSLSVGVVVVGTDGKVIFRNKLAESVTGVIHSDVLVEEVVEQVEDFVENIVLSHPEPLEESRSLPPPPSDEDYDHLDCPVSPCASKKRVKKVVEPKPPRNEKGEYLNSRTNRYVKEGTSSFKQLAKDGVIILESICV